MRAAATASTSGRPRVVTRVASVEGVPAVQYAPACAPSLQRVRTAARSSSKYAVLDVGGVRQVVHEGQTYTCPKLYLREAQPSGSKQLGFTNVVALRSDGAFAMGHPYLGGALVEAELLDEFVGPMVNAAVAAAAATAADSSASTSAGNQEGGDVGSHEVAIMARYRVTRIRGPSSAE